MIEKTRDPLNKIGSLAEALTYIQDGSSLMCGGFGGVGTPPTVINGIIEKGVRHLTVIANDAGFPAIGIGKIVSLGRVKKLIASHIGSNPVAGQLMNEGKMDVEFSPQGTLAERIRAGGVGLGGVLVDIGLDSIIADRKEKVKVAGTEFVIEPALTADVAIVHAKKADHFGNLIYETSARNMNPLVAMAGAFTIAEVDEIVPTGELDPEMIVTPGIFVNMVIESKGVDWEWAWQ